MINVSSHISVNLHPTLSHSCFGAQAVQNARPQWRDHVNPVAPSVTSRHGRPAAAAKSTMFNPQKKIYSPKGSQKGPCRKKRKDFWKSAALPLCFSSDSGWLENALDPGLRREVWSFRVNYVDELSISLTIEILRLSTNSRAINSAKNTTFMGEGGWKYHSLSSTLVKHRYSLIQMGSSPPIPSNPP